MTKFFGMMIIYIQNFGKIRKKLHIKNYNFTFYNLFPS